MGIENSFERKESFEGTRHEKPPETEYNLQAERNRMQAEVVNKMVDQQIKLDKMSDEQLAAEATIAEVSSAYGKELSEKTQAEFDEQQDLDKAA